MAAHDDLIGRTLLGKLRVLRQLGSGAYGAVYEVEHALTHNRHALKILHPGQAQSAHSAERLIREAGIAGRVRSARLVTTLDVGQLEDGRTFILMELLEGRSWRELLKTQGTLNPTDAVRLAIQVCEGLAAAHAAGVVHRDLKPDNVFLIGERGQEEVKILDFGLARNLPGHTDEFGAITTAGGLLGTPHYVSPEQGRGRPDVDGRADQYALGVMLYESLAGKRPFAEATISAMVVKIIQGEYYPLDRVAPHVPPDLTRVVHRAMHCDGDRRFESAEAMALALRGLADVRGNPNEATLDREHPLVERAPTAPMPTPPSEPPSLATTTPVFPLGSPRDARAHHAATPRAASHARAQPRPRVAVPPRVEPRSRVATPPQVEPGPPPYVPTRPRIDSAPPTSTSGAPPPSSGIARGVLIGIVVGLAVLTGSIGGVYLWLRSVPRVDVVAEAGGVVESEDFVLPLDPPFSHPGSHEERELAIRLLSMFEIGEFGACLRASEQVHPARTITEIRAVCASGTHCWPTFVQACDALGTSNRLYQMSCAPLVDSYRGRPPGDSCPPPYASR